MTVLVSEIKSKLPIGTRIPRPRKDTVIIDYRYIKGVECLSYRIGSDDEGQLTKMDFDIAYSKLMNQSSITRDWFYATRNTKPCDYTTLGGIFILLGIATYIGKGTYIKL